MRIKKLKYSIPVILIVLMLASTVIYAAAMYHVSYDMKFETGKVDIHIQELSGIEEGDNTGKLQIADANRELSYIPRIINSGAECYVRAKVKIDITGQCDSPLTLENIYGMGPDWILSGDYFYYTKVLKKGQHADLFKGLHIPENWEYGDADSINVKVEAEAIQSANFEPDFRDRLPWGAVELKNIAAASGKKYTEVRPISSVSSLVYNSEGGFQCSTSDLFDGFTDMMPGDCIDKTIKIRNTAANRLGVRLDVSAGTGGLNEKLDLVVLCDDKEVYCGTVAGINPDNRLNIIEIPKGKTKEVVLRVCLPASTDNRYVKMGDDMVWNFSVEEIPESSAQTGDLSMLVPYIVVAGFALLLAVSARKGKNGTCD